MSKISATPLRSRSKIDFLSRRRAITKYSLLLLVLPMLGGCESINDSRIPAMPVMINLSDRGMWNAYGVSGFGDFNYFVFQSGSPREPAGFPYTETSATGYGGVLLIEGVDPFSTEAGVPVAFDLSCPVEKSPVIRVAVNPSNYEAICPVCDSHYNVTTGAGAPVSGEAVTLHYGLKRYYCHPTTLGGYIITNTQ